MNIPVIVTGVEGILVMIMPVTMSGVDSARFFVHPDGHKFAYISAGC